MERSDIRKLDELLKLSSEDLWETCTDEEAIVVDVHAMLEKIKREKVLSLKSFESGIDDLMKEDHEARLKEKDVTQDSYIRIYISKGGIKYIIAFSILTYEVISISISSKS